jgi:sugar lactone lactonase YvrE
LVTPAFPEYVSGHSTYSAAAAAVLAATFGDDTSFSSTSLGLPGVTRQFTSFSAAAEEAGRSRIYGGIHYEFANQDGQTLGKAIAQQVLQSFQVRSDVAAPRLVLDTAAERVYRVAPTLTGAVLDNLSGVATLSYRVDSGEFTSLTFDNAGKFQLAVPLPINGTGDGPHAVEFRAVDAAGNSMVFSHRFTLDTRAPTVEITAPTASSILGESPVLSGKASGTGSALVALRYAFNNDTPLPLPVAEDGAFAQTLDLTKLSIGTHTLRVEATDAAGLTAFSSVTVTLAAPPALRLEKVWPADGSAELGVTIRPRVDFNRAVDPKTLVSQSLFVSDSAGNRLPATIVPSADNTFAWMFLRDAMPGGIRMTINVDGSLIRGADGQRLDADNDGSPGGLFTSTFTTVSRTVLPNTSLQGVLADPGPDLKPGTPDDVAAGPDGVLMTADDIYKLPIAGARVFILGLEGNGIVTGADGRFRLDAVPSGNVKLVLDGLTATNAPTGVYFPEMVVDLRIDPGVENTVMAAMEPDPARAARKTEPGAYLPRLATTLLRQVDAATGASIGVNPESAPQLTPAQQQLLRIEIQPGGMIGVDGKPLTGGQIGLSTVPPELVRDMLPPGVLEHTFDITVQAPGIANFTVPAPMTFPNVFQAAPGTQLNFLSFDHTTGRLVIEGTATVSADGLSVTTDPGTGITHPGWHGVTPPGGDNKNPKLEPRGRCREPLVDTIFNGVTLLKDIPRLALPLAAGVAAGAAGAALGPGGAITGFNLGFVIVESVAAKVNGVADGIKASGQTLDRGIDGGKTPQQIFHEVKENWKAVTAPTATALANPYTSHGESWRLAIDNATDFGENLVKFSACGGAGGRGTGPAGEFDDDAPALEAAYQGLAAAFGWTVPNGEQLSSFVSLYNTMATRGESLPGSLRMLRDAGAAAARVADLLALEAPTPSDLGQLQTALNQLATYDAAIRNYRMVLESDLRQLRSQIDTLTLRNARPSAPEPTYYVYESSRGVVRGYVADGQVGAFLGASLDGTVRVLEPRTLRVGEANFRSAPSGGQGGAPVLMRSSRAPDSDGDGLPDDAEFIVGTRADRIDTDGDGLSDRRELELGLDPTGGRGLPNGVIAGVDLLGEAKEAVLAPSPVDATRTLALVATGAYGLEIVDTTQLLSPTIIGRLNLPGDVGDVAYDPVLRLAVATGGSQDLYVVDVADPTNPVLRSTVTLPFYSATRVEVRDGIAYVAADANIVVVDIAAATVVSSAPASDILQDLALDGEQLAAIDRAGRIYSYRIQDRELLLRNAIALPISGSRVFLGGGVAYVTNGDGFDGGFATVSFANPDNLQLLSGVDNIGLMGRAIAVSGSGLAVLVGDNGNQGNNADIANVADPAVTDASLTRFALPGLPRGVAIGSGIAFVSASDRGLKVLNFAGADTAGLAPTIAITTTALDRDLETPGQQVVEGSTLQFNAAVTDDVQVEYVEWLVNGSVIGRDVSFPFSYPLSAPALAAGAATFTVQARAVDLGGNAALSAPLSFALVPDTFAPSVLSSWPAEGQRRREIPAITVRLDEEMDLSRLLNSRVHLVRLGPDNTYGTSDDVAIAGLDLSGSQRNQIVVRPLAELEPGDYQLRIDAAAIADRAGNQTVDPFVLRFTKRPLRIPVEYGELVRERVYDGDGDLRFVFQGTVGQRVMLDAHLIVNSSSGVLYGQLTTPSGQSFFPGYLADFENYHFLTETGTYELKFSALPPDTEVSFKLLNQADQPLIPLDSVVGGGSQAAPASAFISLTGSYINRNLRGVDQLDWRASQTVAGERADANIAFTTQTWGSRQELGLTGGSDNNWDSYSVQWDGVIRIASPDTVLFLNSDGGSRLWIDQDLNGQFESTELFSGNWGETDRLSGPTPPLPPGDYPIRVQYEARDGENFVELRWNPGVKLDATNSRDLYRFQGQAGQVLFLDDMFAYAPGQSILYSIIGPGGVLAHIANDTRVSLPATGEYAVRVLSGGWRPDGLPPSYYEFSLLAIEDSTTPLQLNETLTAEIRTPSEIDFYTFQANAGDQLVFDTRVGSRPGIRVDLFSPNSTVVWSGDTMSDSAPISLLDTGTYRLQVSGLGDATGSYGFAMRRVGDQPVISFETRIGDGDSLEAAGAATLYRFTGTAGQRLYFDSLSVVSDSVWTLYGPKATAVYSAPFSQDQYVSLPRNGEYVLALQNNHPTALASYGFRILGVDSQPAAAIGDDLAGTLVEGHSTRLYRLPLTAGVTVTIDVTSATCSAGKTAIYDPNSTLVGGQCLAGYYEFAPTINGEYLFSVSSERTSPVDYSGQITLTSIRSTSLPALDKPVNGSLAGVGDREIYTFDASAGDVLRFFNRQHGENVNAELRDPSGKLLFTASAANDSPFVFASVSGTYKLTLRANARASDFGFSIHKISDGTQIVAGNAFGKTLDVGRDIDVYQWPDGTSGGAMGKRVNIVSLNGSVTDGGWTFHAPDGRRLAEGRLGDSVNEIVLPADGPYWFVVAGDARHETPVAYQFRMDDLGPASGSMSGWETVREGTIVAGGTVEFPLSGVAGFPIYFDSLNPDSHGVAVTLLDADGVPVLLDKASAATDHGPFSLPKSGAYTLRVESAGDGDYHFRLLDLAAAPMLMLAGNKQSLPAHAVQPFRLAMTATERWLLDGHVNATFHATQYSSSFALARTDAMTADRGMLLAPIGKGVNYLLLSSDSGQPGELFFSTTDTYFENAGPIEFGREQLWIAIRSYIASIYPFTAKVGDRFTYAFRTWLVKTPDSCDAVIRVRHVDEAVAPLKFCADSADESWTAQIDGDYFLELDRSEKSVGPWLDNGGGYVGSFRMDRYPAPPPPAVPAPPPRADELPDFPELPAFGTEISASGAIAGYTFSASAGQQFYLDVVRSSSESRFWLYQPDGSIAFLGRGGSNEIRSSGPLVEAHLAGVYTLVIDSGLARVQIDAGFRLNDLSDSVLASNTLVRGSLLPNQPFMELPFVFTATAGQRFYLDLYERSSSSDCAGSAWHVSGAEGVGTLASGGINVDAQFTAPTAGSYLLKFFGNPCPDIRFRLIAPETSSTALSYGEVYGADFAFAGQGMGLSFGGPILRTSGGRLLAATEYGVIHQLDAGSGAPLSPSITVRTVVGSQTRAIAVNAAGELLVVTGSDNFIERFNLDTGELLGRFVDKGAGGLTGVDSMAFGPDGNLYVGNIVNSNGRGAILRFRPDGSFLDTFVPAETTALGGVGGLAFSGNGQLFVADRGSGRIYRFSLLDGSPLGEFGDSTEYGFGIGTIVFAANGDLLAAQRGRNRVIRLAAGTGQYLGDIALPAHVLFTDGFLAMDAAERLIVARRFDGGDTLLRFGSEVFGGCLDDAALCEPGTRREFRFQGQVGQRILFDNVSYSVIWNLSQAQYELFVREAIYQIKLPSGEILGQGSVQHDKLWVLPETGEYVLAVSAAGVALNDFRFRLVDASASPTLNLDEARSVTLSGSETAVFQIQAAAGMRSHVSAPLDTSSICGNFGYILDSYGQFVAEGCLYPPRLAWNPPLEGTYYLIAQRFYGVGDSATAIEVGDRTPRVAALALGETVSGRIDRPGDRDEYTFQGVAGQRLLFSVISPERKLLSFEEYLSHQRHYGYFSRTIYLVSPSGITIEVDPGFDATDAQALIIEYPLTLRETGEYRVVVDPRLFGSYGLDPSSTTDYSFRVSDVSSLPELPLNAAWSGTVTASERSESFVFEAIAGQEFNFEFVGEGAAPPGILEILGPGGFPSFFNLVAGREACWNDSGLLPRRCQFTAAGPGVYIARVTRLYTGSSDFVLPYDYVVSTWALRSDSDRTTGPTDSDVAQVSSIDAAQLQVAVEAAFDAWTVAGLGDRDWFSRRLGSASFEVVDLPSGYFGLTVGDRVLIDHDGDGRGWRLPDAAPSVDDAARVDLLSVVAHEVGHLLGLDHVSESATGALMADRLPVGESRRPTEADVDAIFKLWASD